MVHMPWLTSQRKWDVPYDHLDLREEGLSVKGMIYSTDHGYLNFTVPLFAEYMRAARLEPLKENGALHKSVYPTHFATIFSAVIG